MGTHQPSTWSWIDATNLQRDAQGSILLNSEATTKQPGTHLKRGWGMLGSTKSGKSNPGCEITHAAKIPTPLTFLNLLYNPHCRCEGDKKRENLYGSTGDWLSNKTEFPNNFLRNTLPFQTSHGWEIKCLICQNKSLTPRSRSRKSTWYSERISDESTDCHPHIVITSYLLAKPISKICTKPRADRTVHILGSPQNFYFFKKLLFRGCFTVSRFFF